VSTGAPRAASREHMHQIANDHVACGLLLGHEIEAPTAAEV
jgi:hypothetical protein